LLHSMTGFGAATRENDDLAVTVEIKTVNGRFLKLTTKGPPALSARESELEGRVRKRLGRGSVTLSVDLQHKDPSALVAVNEDLVRAYQEVFRRVGLSEERIPVLPGVLGGRHVPLSAAGWELVALATDQALDALVAMRAREGEALAEVLGELLNSVEARVAEVAERAPGVVIEYQTKLRDRIAALMKAQGDELEASLDTEQLAREVAVFADRSDITEEIDRLAAHIAQARELIQAGGEVGRSLEFVAQEMHREVNTIGSKSSDVAISRRVVGLKADLEKVKEQLANIE